METPHTYPASNTLSYEEIRRLTHEASEEYARRKAERQRLGRERAARTVAGRKREGEACGVMLPPGYRRKLEAGSREPVVDPDVAPLAREAFELAAGGMPLRRILAVLTPKGLVSRSGTPMHASSLRAMVTNPFYAGLIRVERKLVQGRHDAIVDRQTFELVQRQLAIGRQNKAAKPAS